MDVSKLVVVVESQGIEATTTLLHGKSGNGGLYRAAQKVEEKVGTLSTAFSGLSARLASTMSATASISALVGIQNSAMGAAAGINMLSTAMQQYALSANAAVTSMGNATRAMQEKNKWGTVTISTIKAMATAWAIYGSINLAKSMLSEADAMMAMEYRLKNLTGSSTEAAAGMQSIERIAQTSRTPLKDNATLFVRMYDAMKPMGKGGKEAAQATEAVALGLKLWGATGQEASSTMLQLSQAFNKGKLDGQEFNSVAENGKPILKAIADQLGINVSQLGAYRTAGKITNDVMLAALQRMLPVWRTQIATVPMSFDDSMTLVKNSWTMAMDELQKDTGFNVAFGSLIQGVTALIAIVKDGLKSAFESIGPTIEQNKASLVATASIITLLIGDILSLAKPFLVIFGYLLGINQETSILGAALMGVRVVLNVLQSIFVTIGSLILYCVSGLSKLSTVVVGIGEVLIKSVLWGFEQLASGAAKFAEVVGMTALSESLKGVADSTQQMRGGWLAVTKSVWGYTDAIGSAGDAAAEFNKDNAMWTDKGWDKLTTPSGFNDTDSGAAPSFAPGSGKKAPPSPDKKAQSAAEKALKHQTDLMTALRATNAQLKQQALHLEEYGLAYDKLGSAEKHTIALEQQLATLRAAKKQDRTAIGYVEEQLSLSRLNAEQERANKLTQEKLNAYKAEEDKERSRLKAIEDEADALRRKAEAYGQPKGTEDELRASEIQAKLDALKAAPEYGMNKAALDNKATMLALYEKEIEKLQEIARYKGIIAQKEAGAEFDKLLDPKHAEKFGAALSEGFGKAGKSFGKMANALQDYQKRMETVSKLKDLAAKSGDADRMAKASRAEIEAQIRSYADMAGAAKLYFNEGSKGYKAMEAAEKAFRAFQLAMQVESFLRESGLISAITALFVTSETAKTSATLAGLGPHLAVEGAKQGANATTALTSALAAPFPANIAAYAMVAAMLAAIGVSVGGGGGGGDTSKQRQEAQGTGTVFGDSSAKSESISKSIESLSSNSDIALSYSSAMLASLQNIEASLTGVTNAVLRQRGQMTGADFQGDWSGYSALDSLLAPLASIGIPTIVNSVLKSFGFGTSVDLKDSGITAGVKSLSDILENGVDVQSYQDVEKTKKVFGISVSSSTSRNLQDAGDDIDKQFTSIFAGMADVVQQAAPSLGQSVEEVLASISDVSIDMSSISLKGLNSKEIQDQLNAVFSGYGDKIADAAFGSTIDPFRKAGEGGLETVTRLASGIDTATYEMEKLGIAAIAFTDIVNKSGDVAAEIVRDSILTVEAGTGVGEIVKTLSGTAADIASMYSSLSDVRAALKALSISDDVSASLIRAAGGLTALQDALETYTESFFSDAEQQAMKVTSLQSAFAKLGVAVPASREAFRTLVQTLSSTGDSGKELALKVMGLAESFDDVYSYIEQNIEDKRSALQDAYEAQANSMQEVIDKFKDLASSMRDFRESLLTDNISTLSGVDKYNALKEQLSAVYTKAMGGDEESYAKYQELAKSFLEASKEVYSSSAGYTQDFQRILQQATMLESAANAKVDTTQQSLDLLTQQVNALVSIETATLSVEQAIKDLQLAMAAGAALDGSHKNGLSFVPRDGYTAELHRGEAVLTASEAALWRNSAAEATTPPPMDVSAPVGVFNRDAQDSEELKKLRQAVAVLTDVVQQGHKAIVASSIGGAERVAGAIENVGDSQERASYHANAKATLK